MKTKYVLPEALLILAGFINLSINAQTSEKASPFKVTANLVSHYVWRGSKVPLVLPVLRLF